MNTTGTTESVKERILAAASDLFYRQGYRATGVNQIIAAAKVAKASFYDHFPSKDDLLAAYLAKLEREEIQSLRQAVDSAKGVRERFLAPARLLPHWLRETDFRGCPFQNIAAEAPRHDPRVREILRRHRQNVRELLRDLAADLSREQSRTEPLDTLRLVDTYLLLFEGALALAVAYRETWPVDHAIAELSERLPRS